MKIMVITTEGIFFSGERHLVTEPDDAQIFNDIDDLLDRLRDILTLSMQNITQVRIISSTYKM